jgi:hypothetical protein
VCVLNYVSALVVAFAVSAVSYTIAKTKVAAGLRNLVKRHSTWAGTGISCPYCVSHWIAAAAVITFNRDVLLIQGHGIFGYLATWGAIVAVSAMSFGQIGKAVQPSLSPAGATYTGPIDPDFEARAALRH